ncbi:MAG: LysR family transcriptional regulator [Jatrophihabitans endophyticus]|nr:LysR family transcriptional regulator [Jatrophihabitans endophyticus]
MTERSVTKAAQRLRVGQSAMSATLGRLRRLFDDPLLVRQGQHMVTTPRAQSLVAPIREALSIIERSLAYRSAFDPATDHRTFSVVASDYVALVLLRPLLGRLSSQAPNVHVHVRPVGADVEDELRRGLTDLLILPQEFLGQAPGLSSSSLFTDHYVCAVSRDNPHVGDTLTVEQFSAQPYLAYRAGPFRSLAEQYLDAAGIERNLEVTAESFVLAPYLLHGTTLLALIHERLARAVQDHLDLRVLEPPFELSPVTERMWWTGRTDKDPAHAWLRACVLDLAGDP